MRNRIIAGLLAGAAGTTSLNAVTYADMALRGRPWPADLVPHLAYGAVTAITYDRLTRRHRRGLR